MIDPDHDRPEDPPDGDVNRREFLAETARSALGRGTGSASAGGMPPDWPAFARFAESGPPYSLWCPAPSPEGIRPGETVVGTGRKDLILGTHATVDARLEGPRRRSIQRSPLPCGLFIGTCRTLAERWRGIEWQIADHWKIPPGGDWKDQKPFYKHLRDWHLGFFGDYPGLIWAVPFWVLTVNKRMEAALDPRPRLKVRSLGPGGPLSFGSPGLIPDVSFSAKILRRMRFQGAGDDEEAEIIVVNRNRLRRDGVVYLTDNYFLNGSLDDGEVRERGFNRATERYFERIDGWRLHGAWAILSAAFRGTGTRCSQVIYTHQVIDPFTHKSHDIGLIRIGYSSFWSVSYGLTETVGRLMS